MIILSDGSFLTGSFIKGYLEGFVLVKYYTGDILIGQMEKSGLNGLNFFYCCERNTWNLCYYEKGHFKKNILEKQVDNEKGF